MDHEIRVALVGGSETLRKSRRELLATSSNLKVIHDSDGFGLSPESLTEINFDVAVIELRLENQSALDYIKAAFVAANIRNLSFGRVLIAAQFSQTQLRLEAIRAGAVDCVFIDEGMKATIDKINLCGDELSDFGIRELLPTIEKPGISGTDFQTLTLALDTLDEKEAKILHGFCELKMDAEIASAIHVPKFKVRQTISKVQSLLAINTRSQLLLKMFEAGALAL